ncbi:PHD finger protein 20-like, partial [Etheostoma cragini]|uniref:PHD finger protein 20-like n=1 Tax=Etheostoma cragini TaxID=417921 RepID=UPI00155E4818
MKTPPDRPGITFEVGAQLEARDRHKNWYAATIERIDRVGGRVQVHYGQWSRRHNQWFDWSSASLRPLERISLRRRGLNPAGSQSMFVSGTKVLACWTDCRFYPAKILQVNKDDSYTVRFFDGVVLNVKPTKIKPFNHKSSGEKGALGSEGWEDGETEEDEKEDRKEEDIQEEVTSQERDAVTSEEKEEVTSEVMKRKAEPSSSHPPVKKKADDSGSSGALNQPITADSAQPGPPNSAHIYK